MKLRKHDVAVIQLHRAIELFLHQRDFVCSATLAGAAEEILGQLVRTPPGRMSSIDHAKVFMKEWNPDLSDHDIEVMANTYRNALKHASRKDDIHVVITEDDASLLIMRACMNYFFLDRTFTPLITQFCQWYLSMHNHD